MPTLPGILRTTAHAYPDRPALTFAGATTSYREFDDKVDQLAAELIARGTAPGDRIVIISPNTDAFAIAAYAGLRAGAIIAPVNPKSAAAEIEHFMTDTGAATLLFGVACAPAVHAWAQTHPQTASEVSALSLGAADYGEDVFAAAQGRAAEEIDLGLAEDADAVIIYTSGTTGKPKGALFDHHRVIWVGVNASVAFGLRLHDRILHVAPLYHSAALNLLFFTGTMVGAHQVIHSTFDPEAVLAAV